MYKFKYRLIIMNIYSSVDGKNIEKIIILFNSVYINTKNKDLKFYLLVDKIPDTLPYIPDYLQDIITIREINFDKKWKKLLEEFNTHFYKQASWCKNNMNFARFLFFKIFPEIDRVIYLDWDMIVLEDIYNLKDDYDDTDNMIVCTCSGENLFNNVFDNQFKYASSRKSIFARNQIEKIKYHNVGKVLDYLNISYKLFFKTTGFNAGFYIISKHQFNEELIENHLKKLIVVQKKYKCFNFGTQVVMNLMNINNRKFIDKKWNHLPLLDNTITDLNDLYIIHWNGKYKPWNTVSKYNQIWYDYCLKVYPNFKNKYLSSNLKEFDKSDDNTDTNKQIKIKIDKRKPNNINLLKFLNSS